MFEYNNLSGWLADFLAPTRAFIALSDFCQLRSSLITGVIPSLATFRLVLVFSARDDVEAMSCSYPPRDISRVRHADGLERRSADARQDDFGETQAANERAFDELWLKCDGFDTNKLLRG